MSLHGFVGFVSIILDCTSFSIVTVTDPDVAGADNLLRMSSGSCDGDFGVGLDGDFGVGLGLGSGRSGRLAGILGRVFLTAEPEPPLLPLHHITIKGKYR